MPAPDPHHDRPQRVMIVDDNPRALRRLLDNLALAQQSAPCSYPIDSFNSPIRALKAAGQHQYALVLASASLAHGGVAQFLKAFDNLQARRLRVVLAEPEDYPALHRADAGFAGCRIFPREPSPTLLGNLLDSLGKPSSRQAAPPQPPLPLPSQTTLRLLPLLSGLKDTVLHELAAMAHWSRHEPGEILIQQNRNADAVYFLVTGFAKVFRGESPGPSVVEERRSRPRQSVMVSLLGPGQLFGEMSFLLGVERTASVIALTPCELISLPGQRFMEIMQRDPAFAMAMSRELARRLLVSNRQLELMRGDVGGRIHALLRECRQMGLDAKHWLTNAEIARMVGASRVAVSQIINGRGGSPKTASNEDA